MTRRIAVPADRRFLAGWAVVVGAAVIVALVAGLLALRGGKDESGERAAVERAAAAAAEALMTFTPADGPARRAAASSQLTGVLAADYEARGPDVVFPGATASHITMSAKVLDVGVTDLRPDDAHALLFVDQTIRVGDDPGPETVGVARWATMRRIGGVWRLARLEPVSPQ